MPNGFLRFAKDPRNRLLIIAVCVLIIAVCVVIPSYVYRREIGKLIDPFQVEPTYNKELNLFKSLSPNEQAEYLEMSKELKQAKYGTQLM